MDRLLPLRTPGVLDALVRDADPDVPGEQPYILEFSAGNFRVVGTDRAVHIMDLAARAPQLKGADGTPAKLKPVQDAEWEVAQVHGGPRGVLALKHGDRTFKVQSKPNTLQSRWPISSSQRPPPLVKTMLGI